MEDKSQPGYSMHEIDWYAWIPSGSDLKPHRLSLRKNLKTGEFEAYRRFHETVLMSRRDVSVITTDDSGREIVAFRSRSLQKVVDFCNGEYTKYHGEDTPDVVCMHEYPVKSSSCMKPKVVS